MNDSNSFEQIYSAKSLFYGNIKSVELLKLPQSEEARPKWQQQRLLLDPTDGGNFRLYCKCRLAAEQMRIIFESLLSCKNVTHLTLYDCDLNQDMMTSLQMLANTGSVAHLDFDANPLQDTTSYAMLVGEASKLRSLSLRMNKLDNEGTVALAEALSNNKRLVHLSLRNNLIGNEGAKSIAECLKRNKTLMSLNLSKNKIQDEGVRVIAEALAKYPISPDQLAHRKRLLEVKKEEDKLKGRMESKSAINKKSLDNLKESPAKKAPKSGKEPTSKKKEDPAKERVVSAASKKPQSAGLPDKRRRAKELDEGDSYFEINNSLWLCGNRVLANLNLGWNEFGTSGTRFLLDMLIEQEASYDFDENLGLVRLVIEASGSDPSAQNRRNSASSDYAIVEIHVSTEDRPSQMEVVSPIAETPARIDVTATNELIADHENHPADPPSYEEATPDPAEELNKIFQISQMTELQKQMYYFFEKPASWQAKTFHVISFLFIIYSTAEVVCETLPVFTSPDGSSWLPSQPGIFAMEFIVFLWWSIELFGRWYSSTDRVKFAMKPSTWVDIIAILPFFFVMFRTTDQTAQNLARVFRLLRITKAIKLAEYSVGIRLGVMALKRSQDAIWMLFLFVILAMLLTSAAMYWAERGTWNDAIGEWERSEGVRSPFNSIPEGFYWAMTTLATVGYGDVVPITPVGKFLASLTMFLSIMTIALPTSIIGSNFMAEYQIYQRQQLQRKMKKLETRVGDSKNVLLQNKKAENAKIIREQNSILLQAIAEIQDKLSDVNPPQYYSKFKDMQLKCDRLKARLAIAERDAAYWRKMYNDTKEKTSRLHDVTKVSKIKTSANSSNIKKSRSVSSNLKQEIEETHEGSEYIDGISETRHMDLQHMFHSSAGLVKKAGKWMRGSKKSRMQQDSHHSNQDHELPLKLRETRNVTDSNDKSHQYSERNTGFRRRSASEPKEVLSTTSPTKELQSPVSSDTLHLHDEDEAVNM